MQIYPLSVFQRLHPHKIACKADLHLIIIAKQLYTCKYTAINCRGGGIDKYSTSVFLENILWYYYISTIEVADLQAPLNNMLRSS